MKNDPKMQIFFDEAEVLLKSNRTFKDIFDIQIKTWSKNNLFIYEDENGNRMSLGRACGLFEVKLAEPLHDPAMDALNLAYLYDAFIKRTDIVSREYEKVILRYNKMPRPLLLMLEEVKRGKEVSLETLREIIKKELQ